jgi:hypothetical protein
LKLFPQPTNNPSLRSAMLKFSPAAILATPLNAAAGTERSPKRLLPPHASTAPSVRNASA